MYLHPIYKTTDWCPVDSHNERTALDVLLQCCGQLSDEGFSIAIEKPLTNWNGTGTRPDFVVFDKNSGTTLIVETMGFDDAQYLERKKNLIAALNGYSIYEDVRVVHTKRGDQLLHEAVQRFFRNQKLLKALN